MTHFGLHEDDARATFDRQVGQVNEILAELRELVRVTPLEDPEAWPVYGSLISDAQRAVRELDSVRSRAVLPTDDGGGPIRSASTWGKVRSVLSSLGHRSHTPTGAGTSADPRGPRSTGRQGHRPAGVRR